MREERSRSQILFGFLPEQTVDLRGRVWKVKHWQSPIRKTVYDPALRREVARQAGAWAANGLDGGFIEDLMKGKTLNVLTLSMDDGVRVAPFPPVFLCRRCQRVSGTTDKKCRCGSQNWGQLPFVGYHECGALKAPYIPRCKTHNDVKLVLPGTASAAEIRMVCPQCSRQLQRGFGFPACQCGDGSLVFTVHRAAVVYTPRTVVVVNPPTPERIKELEQSGGPARALAWVADGMTRSSPRDLGPTRESFRQQMLDQGFDERVAEQLVEQAAAAGQFDEALSVDLSTVPQERRVEAQAEAVTIAMGVSESRTRIEHLVAGTEEWSERGMLYREKYPLALAHSGIETVELVEKFPVLTGNFGYTRGGVNPGTSRLVPFRDRQGNNVVYADLGVTEAFLVRLRPSAVAGWLQRRGHAVTPWSDEMSARVSLLSIGPIPRPGDNPTSADAGSELLTVVHSLAHRFIRRAAVFAGIDRNALSELIVPTHASFFVYAAARGDFVLGGLQAVFESELDQLLDDVAASEHRCPLDPGCQRAGGACMACLHLGEPSCRYYNSFLDRAVLGGLSGYLATLT